MIAKIKWSVLPQLKDTKSYMVMDKECKYICIKHLVDGLNKICNKGRSKVFIFFCLVHKVQIKHHFIMSSYLFLGSKNVCLFFFFLFLISNWIRAKKHQQHQ